MPRRFVDTEIRYQTKTGCLRFSALPPRPIVVTPDAFPLRCYRDIKCAGYRAIRRVSAWRRKLINYTVTK